jgi:hypothetical protein
MNCPLVDIILREVGKDIGESVECAEGRVVSCCLMMAPRIVLPLIAENNNPTRDLNLAHFHWSRLY